MAREYGIQTSPRALKLHSAQSFGSAIFTFKDLFICSDSSMSSWGSLRTSKNNQLHFCLERQLEAQAVTNYWLKITWSIEMSKAGQLPKEWSVLTSLAGTMVKERLSNVVQSDFSRVFHTVSQHVLVAILVISRPGKWTVKWMEYGLGEPLVSSTKLVADVLYGQMLILMPFNVLFYNLEHGMRCTLGNYFPVVLENFLGLKKQVFKSIQNQKWYNWSASLYVLYSD